MENNTIPDIIVSRLPRYLQAIQRMHQEGQHTTSSKELGQKLGYTAAQIRKDLSQFGEFGKQGTGYSIPYLEAQLLKILKVEQIWKIVLVGAGSLGHAIANYQGFSNRGFQIALILDNDPRIIGAKIGDYIIQDISKMNELLHDSGIKIAMLTVPATHAQKVAQNLVASGIKAILNYAPIPLSLPPEIHVEYFDPLIQLQHITYYLD
jgi:redox-sensing transcriptional repressor